MILQVHMTNCISTAKNWREDFDVNTHTYTHTLSYHKSQSDDGYMVKEIFAFFDREVFTKPKLSYIQPW